MPNNSNISGPDQTYLEYLNQQIFSLPKCLECNEFHFFPRLVCPHCGSFRLEWHPVSGTGEVYSTTTIRRKAERGGDYDVSLITLDEGPRMMSRVDGVDAGSVKIGLRVKAAINTEQEDPFVIFTPEDEA